MASRPRDRATAASLTEPVTYGGAMCRNIRRLHNFEPPATPDEITAAAEQYVRKVSGSQKPSRANAPAVSLAVEQISAATQRLLDSLTTTATPLNRDDYAAARMRASQRRFNQG